MQTALDVEGRVNKGEPGAKNAPTYSKILH
jgi:hypothetical protein